MLQGRHETGWKEGCVFVKRAAGVELQASGEGMETALHCVVFGREAVQKGSLHLAGPERRPSYCRSLIDRVSSLFVLLCALCCVPDLSYSKFLRCSPSRIILSINQSIGLPTSLHPASHILFSSPISQTINAKEQKEMSPVLQLKEMKAVSSSG